MTTSVTSTTSTTSSAASTGSTTTASTTTGTAGPTEIQLGPFERYVGAEVPAGSSAYEAPVTTTLGDPALPDNSLLVLANASVGILDFAAGDADFIVGEDEDPSEIPNVYYRAASGTLDIGFTEGTAPNGTFSDVVLVEVDAGSGNPIPGGAQLHLASASIAVQ